MVRLRPPIVVHRPSPTGGRRVTVRGRIVGLAHSDPDLLLDDPTWVEWRGGRAHERGAIN